MLGPSQRPPTGPKEKVSPKTSVVIPCKENEGPRPSTRRSISEWLWESMKPGVT